jgi:hypothetical protein
MTAALPAAAAAGALGRRDRAAPAVGSPDPAGHAPVIVLATAYSGAARLRLLLERLPDLACTSGTGVVPLCEHALAAWHNADGRPGRLPSALAVSSTRALASVMIAAILAREGKRRWCETCTAMPEAAEGFLRLYPAARFVCLHRSCVGVIRAALDASPWGIADPALAPFTRTYPASTAAALTAYWTAHTAGLLAFEQSHPQAVLRVRLEDLITAGQDTAQAVTSFLGVGPDDDKLWPGPGTSHAEAGHLDGAEGGLPPGLIPPPVLARANDLLRRLGYPALPE